jgi:hypothetical protein
MPDFPHDIAQGERKRESENGASEEPNRSGARGDAAPKYGHQANGDDQQQPHTLVNQASRASQPSFGHGGVESH